MKTIVLLALTALCLSTKANGTNNDKTSIYSTASRGELVIETTEKGKVYIYDENGCLMMEKSVKKGKTSIKTSDFISSTYRLVVKTLDDTTVKKLMVR